MQILRQFRLTAVLSGVLTATSIAHNAFAQAQWRVAKDLTIGAGNDDKAMFVDIRGIAAGPTGNIFVLDFREQEIRMFNTKGEYLKTVARRGSGPGELRNANGMLVAKDGTLWVNDPGQRRWPAYSATTGDFQRQVSLPITGYGYLWEAGFDSRGRIIDPITVTSATLKGPDGQPSRERVYRRVDVTSRAPVAGDTSVVGPPADTVPHTTCFPRTPLKTPSFVGYDTTGRAMAYSGIPFAPRSQSVLGQDGTLWCTGSDEYAVVHRTVGRNDSLHFIRGTYPAPPVTAAERDEAIAAATKFLARYARKDMDVSLIPGTKPIVEQIALDRAGRVWVRRTPTSATAPSVWEVYDPTGKILARATANFTFRSPVPPFITDDAMYVVLSDEDGVLTAVRARITR
jgi:hypothetical protein